MPKAQANGIELEYDTFGSSDHDPLLLVMGIGAQMIKWHEEFCRQLVDAEHYVIRFDNRDAGLSAKFSHLGTPDIASLVASLQAGKRPEAPYTLDDMADDGIGLLDFLGIDKAHVCGASMGGMIVQVMAIRHPDRILTMTSIMSTTGNPQLPPSEPEAMSALLSPPANSREENIERSMQISRVLGGGGFEVDEEDRRRRAGIAYDRSFFPEGFSRQMAAVVAHGNRKPALADVEIPALVIHGREDPLVPLTGGLDTHEALPNAELLVIGGMGHELPRGAWPEIVDAIRRTTARNTVA